MTSVASGHLPLPRVTVVTVALNLADVIERTIASVVSQDYPDLEYIVVDGASTDGTLGIIRRYEAHITRWVSGRDGGPYGGMNRGVSLANGEWVIFMNGGDRFVANDVISRTFAAGDPSTCDVIYGDSIVCGPGYRALEIPPDEPKLTDGNDFSHQATFVRTALLVQYGFDTTETIAADYDFFLKLKKARKVFRHVGVVVAEFYLGGASTLSESATIRLRHRVYRKHFPRSDLRLRALLAQLAAKRAVRAMLPTRLWRIVSRVYRRGRIVRLDVPVTIEVARSTGFEVPDDGARSDAGPDDCRRRVSNVGAGAA